MERSYEAFRALVREDVKKRLACFELSDEDIDKFLNAEEDQIKGAYQAYAEKDPDDMRSDEARFNGEASTVSMCLEYCY